MRQKDREHFGIQEGGKGPLESIFSQSDFQGLAPLARTVKSAPMSGRWSASPLSTDTSTWALLSLRLTWMQSRTQLGVVSIPTIAMASWRGYANMLLGRIQYVGKAYAFNKSPEAVSPRGALGPGGPLVPGHVHT